MQDFFNFRLRNAPRSVKALVAGYLFALSLAYLYALGNIALVVGITPKSIAIHYYGAEKKVDETPIATGEEEFSLDEATPTTDVIELGARPSFKNLVGIGHFHLFGMSSFFFGLCLIGLFTSISEKWKVPLVFTPFVAVVLDNLSFLATRFLGPAFAYLTAISGAIMGLTFSVLWTLIVIELFKKKDLIK